MNVLAIFIILPVVGAFIGYVTKWAAMKMMFKPARFVGIGPIGWQGVVQRRAPKFAAGIADTVTGTAIDMDELLDRIDLAGLASLVAEGVAPRASEIAATVAESLRPGEWSQLDAGTRQRVADDIASVTSDAIEDVASELKPLVRSQLDVRGIIVKLLSGEDADRLATLIQGITTTELRWMIRFGAVCGFYIGVIEAIVYTFLDQWWLLPVVGAFDGLFNNWLALQMMFRPLEPTRYLGLFTYQGLFSKRQQDIADKYGQMLGSEVLTPRNLYQHMVDQRAAQSLLPSALAIVQPHFEKIASVVGDALSLPQVDARKDALPIVAGPLQRVLAPLATDIESYLERSLDVTGTIRDRMGTMEPLQFEEVLRSIFREDERTILLLGGVLGIAIGALQAVVVLSTGIGH